LLVIDGKEQQRRWHVYRQSVIVIDGKNNDDKPKSKEEQQRRWKTRTTKTRPVGEGPEAKTFEYLENLLSRKKS
jgi:hypothetical protein